MMRTISAFTAAVVLLAFSNLFAQTEVPVPALPSESVPPSAPTMEGDSNGKTTENGGETEGKGRGKEKRTGKGRGKSSDKLRGLDRADEVTGEHGKQGRGKARSRGKRGKD